MWCFSVEWSAEMVGDHNNSYELLIHYTNKFSFLVRFALKTKKKKKFFGEKG